MPRQTNNRSLHSSLSSSLPHQKVPAWVDNHCVKTLQVLQERTRVALKRSSDDPATAMKLIDSIQRLGVGYDFDEEINAQLERFSDWNIADGNLFVHALRFRLLRHNGWPATTDIFQKFVHNDGQLKGSMSKDTWAALSLYEASYSATQGEDRPSRAMESTTTQYMRHVAKALELPRHLRMERLEARNYIDEDSKEWNHNLSLL